ncbi:methyltransferase domain-containing protein [Blastopirellula sp. J2-11]|uniref:class I SAM-dependent methyltransferase n=1 Tax=Blastopirellula sp. J2-11 TaxID=2943192 RepID=UPI0021C5C44D|nr:methyltransferase domain-containing protein [Blastopirellula sp. J2-11]UUO06268.1 methyltransferase domain-containing protein [Blastopirellula sp. J2-11]
MSTAMELDEAKIEAFAARFLEAMNGAAMMLMSSIGHRTGLFDTMADLPAATSEEVAAAAGLNERYVREWLNALVSAQVIDFDRAEQSYRLPAEHAALLTRAATPSNLASVAQWIAVLGYVETQIVDKFSHGGGVCYHEFHRFHDVMAEESSQTTVSAMIDHILPLVDGLIEKLERGIDVLDVGCGSAKALILLAERFPHSRFYGYDLCADAIVAGRRLAEERDLPNLTLKVRDVSQLVDCDRFDLITAFDAIHDQAYPDQVLNNISRALRRDGIFLMQDIRASSYVEKNIDQPLGAFIYTISCMHCMSVSLAQGGMGLGAAWGEEMAQEMLISAGFSQVDIRRLDHDIINNYYLARLG